MGFVCMFYLFNLIYVDFFGERNEEKSKCVDGMVGWKEINNYNNFFYLYGIEGSSWFWMRRPYNKTVNLSAHVLISHVFFRFFHFMGIF